MNEIGALLVKAQRYLKSAKLLLEDGDYESVSAVSEEEAREILIRAQEFCDEIGRWLNKSQE